MSVPVFFEPFKLPLEGKLPDAGAQNTCWADVNGYEGIVPDTAVFCDGGVLSNFPLSQFHNSGLFDVDGKEFMMPTIGAQLSPSRKTTQEIKDPLGLLRAMSTTSAHLHDQEFMHNHPEYKHLTAVSLPETLANSAPM